MPDQKNLNVTIQQSSLGKIIVVVVLVVAGYVAATCHSNAAMAKWRDGYNAYRDTVAITLHNDSLLKRVAQQQHDSFIVANSRADSLGKRVNILVTAAHNQKQRTDSLQKVVDADTTTPAAAKELIADLNGQIDTLNDALDSDRVRDSLRVAAINKLSGEGLTKDSIIAEDERQLAKLPKAPPKEKILGFIPKPSPEVSFIAGAVIGAVLHAEFNKVTNK